MFAVALALRLVHLWQIQDSPFALWLNTDPAIYDEWAKRLVGGDWAGRQEGVFYQGPLYPYFMAVVYASTGPTTWAVRGAQAVLSSVSAALVAYVGRRHFCTPVGWIAGLATAAYGPLIFYSGELLPETLITFLDLVLLAALGEALRRDSRGALALAGLAFGLSAAARGTALLFGPFVLAALALRAGPKCWCQWVPQAALFCAVAALPIAPVALHNLLIGGDAVLLTANSGINLYIGNHSLSDGLYMRPPIYEGRPLGNNVASQRVNFRQVAETELGRSGLRLSEVSSFWTRKTLQDMQRMPRRWLRLMLYKTYFALAAYEVPNNRNYEFSKRFSSLLQLPLPSWGAGIGFAFVGVVVTAASWRRHGFLLGFGLAQLASLVAFFVISRYRLPLVPIMLIYAAAGVGWIWLQARRWRLRRCIPALLAAAAVTGSSYAVAPGLDFATRDQNLGTAYRELRRYDEALAAYDRALEVHSDWAFAHFQKGMTWARMGRLAEARRSFERAIELATQQNDTYVVGRARQELAALR